jgi:hypothetical protein
LNGIYETSSCWSNRQLLQKSTFMKRPHNIARDFTRVAKANNGGSVAQSGDEMPVSSGIGIARTGRIDQN